MLVSLTVGKVDAGVAVLLTEDKRLIEFPSILLPPDISSGSIVDVNVSRNYPAENQAAKSFDALESQILSAFGSESPAAPVLRCRNATQTSVVLEWDPIALATASLRSLSLYRNGNKAGAIPRPLEITSTKISGLAVDSEYTFYLVLKTSAGTYSSEKLTVRTHKMTDLSGITVTPGFMPREYKEDLEATVERMGAKLIEQVRIDTTHFVCTEGRGTAWEKAADMNIPIVVPDWLKACEKEGRLVGVRGYYLNAERPKQESQSQVAQSRPGSQSTATQQQQQRPIPERQRSQRSAVQQQILPTTQVTPPTPEVASAPTMAAETRSTDTETPTPTPSTKSEIKTDSVSPIKPGEGSTEEAAENQKPEEIRQEALSSNAPEQDDLRDETSTIEEMSTRPAEPQPTKSPNNDTTETEQEGCTDAEEIFDEVKL